MARATPYESIDLDHIRRCYAEEVRVASGLRSTALVEALACTPRERYLGTGPWLVRGVDADLGGQPRPTSNADCRHVYHNVSIALDPARQLFNGQPGTIALWLDALDLRPGNRVLHIGCATGYYSEIMAHMVGRGGFVTAIEIDADLAGRARENLRPFSWVEARQGDGTGDLPPDLDAIVVNAGVTHPLPVWLDSLGEGGRMILPLTFTAARMPAGISKGGVLLVTRDHESFAARFISMVAIYSCVGVRDEELNGRLLKVFVQGNWFSVRRLRRDPHEPAPDCWLHEKDFCLAS